MIGSIMLFFECAWPGLPESVDLAIIETIGGELLSVSMTDENYSSRFCALDDCRLAIMLCSKWYPSSLGWIELCW